MADLKAFPSGQAVALEYGLALEVWTLSQPLPALLLYTLISWVMLLAVSGRLLLLTLCCFVLLGRSLQQALVQITSGLLFLVSLSGQETLVLDSTCRQATSRSGWSSLPLAQMHFLS